MTYGLIGISGLYNFGCEAIVRGTYKFLKDRNPECTVVYYSRNYEFDKTILHDIDVVVERVSVDKSFIRRCINKFFIILKIGLVLPDFKTTEIIKSVDAIVSIGGDIFTIPKAKREKSKYHFTNPYLEFSRRAIKAGKPVYLYGASVGPFGEYRKATRYYTRVLRDVKKIVCREFSTTAYLSELGLDNFCFSPDPAFLVERVCCGEKKKEYIGVNLSPLSLIEIYGSYSEDRILKMSQLLENIYCKFGYDILLIPHVISLDVQDDDLRFLQNIKKIILPEMQDHFYIADYSKGFLGIKEQLLKCQILFSARMHCAINAIHESIPTIFLSYSSKSIGMARFIYGNEKWVIDLRNIDDDLVSLVGEMLLKRNEISHYLELRNTEIKQFYEKQKSELDNLYPIFVKIGLIEL